MTRLPPPPPESEVPRNNSLDALSPRFRARLNVLLDKMMQRGWDPMIYETVRTQERQNYLWGFGREYDDDRGVVTHSHDADESWHFYGLAADIVSRSKEWGAPPSFWRDLGIVAHELGLQWGGNWHMKDLPHIQWGSPMRDSPSPRAARLYAEGGVRRVWREVGAL